MAFDLNELKFKLRSAQAFIIVMFILFSGFILK